MNPSSHAIPTIETQSATQRSLSLWEPLRRRFDLDVLSALNMAQGNKGAYCCWADSEGTPQISQAHRSVRGEHLWTTSWSPHLPKRTEVNRLCAPLTAFRKQSQSAQQLIFDRFYGRFEGTFGRIEKLRLLAFHQGRFQGYVGALRHGRPFSRRERQRLTREGIPELLRALEVRNCLESEFEGADASVLLRANGTVEFASEAAAAWLNQERNHELGRIVRHADAGLPPLGGIGKTEVHLTRLMGLGGARYLAVLRPAAGAVLHPFHRLSLRQRDVAECAATGAQVREISERLEITPETTRQHLKSIYQTLGIGCRVELSRLHSGRHVL